MSYKRLYLFAAALVGFLPATAMATEMEYYVYGGHDAVVSALTKLALIFSQNSYLALFGMAFLMAVSFGGAAVYAKIVSGANVHPLSFAPSIIVGVCIYLVFIVPKGTLHVYDPVYNRDQAVANLPDGLVILAGSLNAIERNLVNFVTIAGDPVPFTSHAGGMGFLGLSTLTSIPLTANQTYIDNSLYRYVSDCVSYELMRPGTDLSVNELRKGSAALPQTNFVTSLEKAASPAVDTIVYTGTDTMGTAVSCKTAWDDTIKTALNTASSLSNISSSTCSQIGFTPAVVAELNDCKSRISEALAGTNVATVTTDEFIRQVYISQRLDQVLRQGNTAGTTNYQFLLSASGSMKAANDWLPSLRAGLLAITIGIIPFIALFIPTSLCGRALATIAGLFIWNTTWGITDAVVHQFAIDYANKAYEQVRQNTLGMDAIYFFPAQTVKLLGVFGMLRMSGMALATVITGMLVKFGGSAMAHMAGGISGSVQNSGNLGAQMTESPAGNASAIKANVDATPTRAWANSHAFGDRAGQTYAQMSGATEGHSMIANAFNGIGGATRMKREGAVGRETGYAAQGAASISQPGGLAGAYVTKTFGANVDMAKTGALQDIIKGYAGGVAEYAKTAVAQDSAVQGVFGTAENYQDFITTNLGKSAGQTAGDMAAYAGAQQLGFQGSYQNFHAFRSEVQSLGDYTSVAAVGQVATKYGMKTGQAMQMNAQFQAAKHLGESNKASDSFGSAIEGGTQFGLFAATGTAGQVEGVYASGGMDSYQSMMSGSIEGQMARNDLVRQAANKMVNDGQILQGIKNDPDYIQNGHLNEKGFALAQQAMQGQNISFATSDGTRTLNLDANGNVTNSSTKGTFTPGDAESQANVLGIANSLDKQARGHGKSAEASKIRQMVASGRAFEYQATMDKKGHIAVASAERGGEARTIDNASNEQLRKDSTGERIDKGLRSTIGNQTWRGNKGITEKFHQDKYTDASGTHERYSWSDKSGAKHTVSGSDDGLLHMSVQKNGKVANITADPVSGEVLLENTTSGQKDVLYAGRTEISAGTHVDGAANAGASRLASYLGVDQKDAELVFGTLQGVTAEVLPIAGAVGGTAATMRTAGEKAANTTERAAEKAANTVERATEKAVRETATRVQQTMQKTSKVLQNQSRTSNLPKSGGPAPLRK